MINAPDWDVVDGRIAAMQELLRVDLTTADRTEVRRGLTDLRGDLASLRYFAQQPAAVTLPEPAEKPAPTSTAAYREAGFTGNVCYQCGGSRMLPDGTCELCQDCGATASCN